MPAVGGSPVVTGPPGRVPGMPSTVPSLAVIGQGYVGLPLALRASQQGFRVVGYEVAPQRVAALREGRSYVGDVSDDIVDWITWYDDSDLLDVNPGNSGGPLWYDIGNGPYVVGIVSTGEWAADVGGMPDTILDWIDGNDSLIANANLADELFGWHSVTPFEEGLKRTIEWFSEKQVVLDPAQYLV